MSPEALSLLICTNCRATAGLQAKSACLVCSFCGAEFPLHAPGIPGFIVDGSLRQQCDIHQKHWDDLPDDDYDQVCDDNAPTLTAIDSVHLQHCRGTVLEVGAGAGRFLQKLAGHSEVKHFIGVDVSLGMLRRAWRKTRGNLVHAPGEVLPFRGESFDTVASTFSSMKYVDRTRGYAEIARVLRAGGYFVFDMINYWPYLIDHLWWSFISKGQWPTKGFSNEYILRSNLRSARSEVQMLKGAGFTIVEIKSVRYLPFLRRLIKHPGYWNGYLGTKIGFATLFVCQKTRP